MLSYSKFYFGGKYMKNENNNYFFNKKVATFLLLGGMGFAMANPLKVWGGPIKRMPNIDFTENYDVNNCFYYTVRDGEVFKYYNHENVLFMVNPDTSEIKEYLYEEYYYHIYIPYGGYTSDSYYYKEVYTDYRFYDFDTEEALSLEFSDFKCDNSEVISLDDIGLYLEDLEDKENFSYPDIKELEPRLLRAVQLIDNYKEKEKEAREKVKEKKANQ